ncbi:MAG: RagB/SusD family nutrient uptake outer membrane protein [Bacteroidales bacterium]|nr:RagB/SusD family nutrient uptake outer membrane protein [Bacteroidales bacterium]
MKKLTSYILIALAALTLASCSDFLDVKLHDQATLEEMFTQGGNAHRYLRHIYSFIPEEESISNREGWVVARSDEAQFSWTQWVYYLIFREGNYSSATTVASTDADRAMRPWDKFYQAISQCSIFINNIDLMKEYNNKDAAELAKIKKQMKAEAKFLRAYYYYCLIRQYGPVYIWMDSDGKPVTPDLSIDGSKIERNTMQECFDFILAQLDEAIAELPVHVGDFGEVSQDWMGRATKGAAMAVKCRVALMQASPLYNGQNGTGLYDDFVSKYNGKKFFETTYDASKWDVAAKAHRELIALAETGEYALVTDASTSEDPMQAAADNYQAIFQKTWNKETIWGWWKRESSEYGSYLAGAGQIMCCALAPQIEGVGGYAGITPSLKLVDAFPMQATGRYPLQLGNMYQKTDGRLDYSKPNVDPLSGYQAEGWKEGYKVPVNAPWAPGFKAHVSTTGRDARFYQCIVPNGFPWPNENKKKFFTCYNNSECTSPFRTSGDSNRAGYMWRKWYPTNRQLDNFQAYQMNVVYPSIRLAEIYLNYAECLIEQSSPKLDSACFYINKVRNRAGLNNIEVAYAGINTNKDLLREALRMERMVEFNGEAVRHYDAVRWMIAPEEYTTRNWTLKCSATTYEESWERVPDDCPLGDPTFIERDYLFPIYSGHLAQMTNMTQNPGF